MLVKGWATLAHRVVQLNTSRIQEIIVVTGPAGAGRSTAIKAIEDFGIEAIDNLPISLIDRMLSGPQTGSPIAIGIDSRTRGFSSESLMEVLDNIERNPKLSATLLFLDCSPDTLLRRFSETRRRHPASPDGSPRGGILHEIDLMSELRNRADILIDTSELSPNQLKEELAHWFQKSKTSRLSILVQSFSYKRGTPRGVDMKIDCRFLRNPHWEPELRSLTGLSEKVEKYVQADPVFNPFFEKLTDLLDLLLPAYEAEGKAYFNLALGCTGGQHRSVFVAEKLSKTLAKRGWMVSTRHKEMERWPVEEKQA